ncbi:hypothetical protein Ahy_B05g077555 [Arachis hypogaea]|uniref:Uncharacterized protein n=1 Tax=Arachis hypogaea TaxID=3818 RepID=A0A444Z572_ARAHY|nr:hypothetical protein Ahy_B05g077555 [Arachis hypogaea]
MVHRPREPSPVRQHLLSRPVSQLFARRSPSCLSPARCLQRRQYERELKKLEEKTARRIEEAIQKNIEEKFDLEEVILEIERRIAEGVKKLFDDVEVQLEKEKQDALNKTRRKELISYHHYDTCMISKIKKSQCPHLEQARKVREWLDKMLEENSRRVEEAQRREALELQQKDEEW